MVCPQCHRDNPPGTARCAHCGALLAGQAAWTPADGDADAGGWAPVPESPRLVYTAGPSPAPRPGDMIARPEPVAPAAPLPSPTGRPMGRFAPPSTPLTGAVLRPTRPRRASSPALDAVFGPGGLPATGAPATRLQVFLWRVLGAQQVPGRWASAIVGAVVAAVIGLLATGVSLALWKQVAALLATPATYGLLDGSLSGQAQADVQLAQPFLTVDLFKMLALEHGIPVGYGSGAFSTSLSLPLGGFLLLPAVALTLGGCLSGAGDFQRRARFSIARGALIGPFYAIFLAICAFLSASPLGGAGAPVSPSVPRALLYGLLWGIVFGGWGGWIQLAGRDSLGAILPTLRAAAARSGIAGRVRAAMAGAAAAVGSGVLFSLVVCLAGFAFLSAHSTALTAAAPAAGGQSPLAGLGGAVLLALAVGPTAGVWTFALASGGPFATSGPGAPDPRVTQHVSLGLIGAQHGAPSPSWYLLVLVPVVCYLVGGRVAARAWGAREARAGLLAGTLTAVPAALLMAAAAYLATFRYDVQAPDAADRAQSLMAGPDVGRTVAATFVLAAVCGAVGGWSAVVAPALGKLSRLPLLPLRPLGAALLPLFDRLAGHPRGQPPSTGRRWLYDAWLVTLVAVVVALLVDIASVAGAGTLPYRTWAEIAGVGAAAVVGAPLACYVCALVAAVVSPPAAARAAGEPPDAAGVIAAPQAWQPYAGSPAGGMRASQG